MLSGRVYQLIFTASKSPFFIDNATKFVGSLHRGTIVRNTRRVTSIMGQAQSFTTSGLQNKNEYNLQYEDILKVQKEDSTLMIDVREQNEINETKVLPGSIHIPMGKVSQYLTSMPDEEFKNTFHKNKPTKESKIVLSCKSGMRSGKVQEELRKLGYNNVYNYTGGFMDWAEKTQ